MTLFTALFVFLLVIAFHEFGHFAVAKLVGIKVNEFSIGMGPALLHKKSGETQYSLRAIPIGGYVAMEGETDSSSHPRSFQNAPVMKRIMVVVAGAIMNFILGFLVLFIAFSIRGADVPVIAQFTPESALEEAGFQRGDRIVQIGEVPITTWEGLRNTVSDLPQGEEVSIKALRNGEEIQQMVRPKWDEKEQRILIGLLPAAERDFGSILTQTATTFVAFFSLLFQFFRMLFAGQVGIGDVSGPVGIVRVIGEASRTGIVSVLTLMGLISVNVGFFNLLPIPALDGGKILFLLIEAVRGKPMPAEREGLVTMIGFVLLLLLIGIVTFRELFG